MSRPKKKRGFRLIILGNQRFRWRFEAGYNSSLLKISADEGHGQPLIVTLPNWRDPWLNLNGFDLSANGIQLYTSAQNTPYAITSKFVHMAILFALSEGWQPTKIASSPMRLLYQHEKFSLFAE